MICAVCGHLKRWHKGSRMADSDGTECLFPTEGGTDECSCTSFMTEKQYDAVYGKEKSNV